MQRMDVKRAILYGRTVRHLSWRQVGWRVWNRARKRLGLDARGTGPQAASAFSKDALGQLRHYADVWARHGAPNAGALAALHRGEITFLNRTVNASVGAPWDGHSSTPGAPPLPRLWLYHLHAFDHVVELCLHARNETSRELVLGWISDWIAANPVGGDIAWDAYPLSCRLMNWSLAAATLGVDSEAMRRSMLWQAQYLMEHLERDIEGNHLVKNAAALWVAGRVLGANHLHSHLLDEQLREQLLADGGHYERTPRYHLQVLQDCMLCLAVTAEPPPFLNEAVRRMLEFLAAVCHEDGQVALFGDTTQDEPSGETVLRVGAELLGIPKPQPPQDQFALTASGIFGLTALDGGSRLLVKAGPPGAPRQPAHAHGDALSFELSAGGVRVVVDTGVHGYAESPWRAYCRSTAAHNTVVVNGREQLEAWDVFRVARRYTMLHASVGKDAAGRPSFRGAYRAYQGHVHERTIVWREEGFWLVVDRVTERGPLSARSFLRLLPDADVRVAGFGGSVVEGTGLYFPRFGEEARVRKVELDILGKDTVTCGWGLFLAGATMISPDTLAELAESVLAEMESS